MNPEHPAEYILKPPGNIPGAPRAGSLCTSQTTSTDSLPARMITISRSEGNVNDEVSVQSAKRISPVLWTHIGDVSPFPDFQA
jgi:hypothetical protein